MSAENNETRFDADISNYGYLNIKNGVKYK